MKILFASEVFPMRNSFTEHSLVSREFLSNISNLLSSENSNVDARLFCNNPTIDIIFSEYMKYVPSIIRMSDDMSKYVEKSLKDWGVAGLHDWNEYVRAEGPFSTRLYNELLDIHSNIFEFDMIVCWGENGVYDKLGKKLGIPCLHLELSSTRIPFFEGRVFDIIGANGSASTKNIKIEELKNEFIAPPIDFWSAYYNIKDEGNTEVLGFDDSSLTYWNEDLTLDIFKSGKNKTALIGLQLFDDANTQRYSSYNSPLEFLQDVLPKLIKSGWDVIVKTHPGAIHRPVNFIEQNKAINYAKSFEGCYIYDHVSDPRNYLALLRSVDLVVVINSSMGFEATLLGKTVVVMGEALYKIHGVYPSLNEAINSKFSHDAYMENISYVAYFFCKYIFLERDKCLKLEFYTAVNDYFKENIVNIEKGHFSVRNYINSFGSFSRKFINEFDDREEYKELLTSYIFNSPRKGSHFEMSEKKDSIYFSQSKTKVSLIKDSITFNIDGLVSNDDSLYIEGWAFERNRRVPPIIVSIFSDNKVLHVGRLSANRKDVQEFFELSHPVVGFKFRIALDEKIDKISLLFVHSDGKATLTPLMDV